MIERDNFGRIVTEGGARVHVQSSPSDRWEIKHNLGREIVGHVAYNNAGEAILVDVDQGDLMTAYVPFLWLESGKFPYT